jgi:hypothetical protein
MPSVCHLCFPHTWVNYLDFDLHHFRNVILTSSVPFKQIRDAHSSGRKTHVPVASRKHYEGVTKRFGTGRLERELQMVQLCATWCSCITILWVSLVSFAAITLCVASERVFISLSTQSGNFWIHPRICSDMSLQDTPELGLLNNAAWVITHGELERTAAYFRHGLQGYEENFKEEEEEEEDAVPISGTRN